MKQDQKCDYGCHQIAKYKTSNGKNCCSKHYNSCPSIRIKNKNGLKKAYNEGRKKRWPLTDNQRAWNKGLTKETDKRVQNNANQVSQYHKNRIELSKIDKEIYQYYKGKCSWTFGNNREIIARIKGYELLKEHGMYHKKNNLTGVVRDHRLSTSEGFKKDILPEILLHPANCEFITHKNNARKSGTSSISLEELLIEIKRWNN